jgi:hypothetical protein
MPGVRYSAPGPRHAQRIANGIDRVLTTTYRPRRAS